MVIFPGVETPGFVRWSFQDRLGAGFTSLQRSMEPVEGLSVSGVPFGW